jgi:hypothetical protein
MIIKRGKCEIVEVIADSDHKLDDEGTRKALEAASKKLENKKHDDKKHLEN